MDKTELNERITERIAQVAAADPFLRGALSVIGESAWGRGVRFALVVSAAHLECEKELAPEGNGALPLGEVEI